MVNDTDRQASTIRPPVADAARVAVEVPSAGRPRQPYVAPKLRYLGKVAELTFTASLGSKVDGGHAPKSHKIG
jgi:hypothetical protein